MTMRSMSFDSAKSRMTTAGEPVSENDSFATPAGTISRARSRMTFPAFVTESRIASESTALIAS